MHHHIEDGRSVFTDFPPSPTLKDGPSGIDMRIRSMRPVVPSQAIEPKLAAEVPWRSSVHHRSNADMVALGMSNVAPGPHGRDPPRAWTRTRVLFYHKTDPHYGFTNFSPHPVYYDKKRYPTSEHLFQSLKFQPHRPRLAEHIRTCSERPSVAFSEARRFQPEVRSDWKDVNIQMMDLVLWYKFMQHESLKKELLATDDAELVEDSDKDAFWGVGADRRGRNELGKALERLRTKLK
ncbi:DUF1768 domain-containing protein [Mycena sanguinolenta]|uniref:DUF1768 domain-containing protein n=1 Tax=Mycena sanguinolenta TaxID=230812 RepID=A0A8H6ZI62_9AGAR|nr:DUF1768 domain-containing protein [Mycena sanguinolenta]